MSGLSARTNSWGGDGARCFRGGEATSTLSTALPGRGAFEKNLRMPSFLVNWRSFSTSDGTEESSEDSSPELIVGVGVRGVLVLALFER